MITQFCHPRVDRPLLDSLATSWAKRATVRKELLDYERLFDERMPDFPLSLVPFRDHPAYACSSETTRQRVLAGMWSWYNEKTIAIEEVIVNPGCRALLHDRFQGASDPTIKGLLCETVVDEDFHILMCLEVCSVSRRRRQIERLTFDEALLCRLRRERLNAVDLEWEKDLVVLAYMSIAELTINAYLKLLSGDHTIQPVNRLSTEMHLRDEASHARMFRAVLKEIYREMTPLQQQLYVRELRGAYASFVATEWTPWARVLSFVGFDQPVIDELKEHSRLQPQGLLRRDLSSVVGFAEDIGVPPKHIVR